MRHLTIKRNKTFVGCAGKLRVYIEDPAIVDIEINGVGCRKLGTLKNGEEKTFEIGENAGKVFVIADQMSKGFCNEYYELPEGQEDVALAGQCKFNPATGNAFRFDDNNSAEVLANRKKSTQKGIGVLIAAVIVGLISGFGVSLFFFGGGLLVKDKMFSSNGVTITLTNEFHKTQVNGLDAAYESRDVIVGMQKESFGTSGWENASTRQYIDAVIANNPQKFAAATVTESDGLVGFTYQALDPGTKQMCHYYYYAYKTDDAFWLVQFAVLSKDAPQYEQRIVDWAKSVEFAK